MKSKNIILAGIVGLDLSNAAHAVFIAETTKGIKNINMFIDFCRDTKEGITYTTKTERLDILANRFKQLEEAHRLKNIRDDGELSVSKLVSLVGDCRIFIKNERDNGNLAEFKHLRIKGEHVFTLKQLEALSAVGSTDCVIHQYEAYTLKDSLMKIYMDKFKKKASYKALGSEATGIVSVAVDSLREVEVVR